jgi:pyruvate dehydrogenase E2 component (dihydrolipoamide acetyltransferase)
VGDHSARDAVNLADITGFEEIRKRHTKQAGAGAAPDRDDARRQDFAAALRRFPQFNVSIDSAEDIIVKQHHVGVAVDTDRGLLVPVVVTPTRRA